MGVASYRVVRAGELESRAPRFATQGEAEVYRRHLASLDPPVETVQSEAAEAATHLIEDGLMRRLGADGSLPEVVARSVNPEAPADFYDLALEHRVAELAEEGTHAVACARHGQDGLTVVVAPGDSTTPWSVEFLFDPRQWNAAQFTVDVGSGFMAAPGMTPDAKPGYVIWEVEEARAAIVFRDPDRSELGATIESLDGYLPETDGQLFADDLADLAQLVAEIATGWRDYS